MIELEDLGYIERRITRALQDYSDGDLESCALNLWPAIDNTAKRRHGGGVASRIKKFLNETTPMVTYIATSNVFKFRFNGVTVFDLIYKLARTSIVHEGKDDINLTWSDDGSLLIAGVGSANQINVIPKEYLVGMAIAVVTAPENASLRSPNGSLDVTMGVFGSRKFSISELWGAEDYLYAEISAQMGCQIGRWTEDERAELPPSFPFDR